MIFWVGVTDKDWFDYLAILQPDEVNFWQPSAKAPTNRLNPGDLFLFKLHAPHDYVVGGGFFVRFTTLPIRLAWEVFGTAGGVRTYDELLRRLQRYRRDTVHGDAEIGCNILNAPFFFPEDQWIPIPGDWSRNIVRGKTYDTGTAIGARLLAAVRERVVRTAATPVEQEQPRYGSLYLGQARLGQGAFRVLVIDAYRRRCAVTGERTLPVLEAAHIRPFTAAGPNRVNNGLLLRADIHRLFDNGYVTLDPDYRFLVSPRVREAYENGREYYRYHGAPLANLPEPIGDRPSRDFIDWHNEHVFVG